MMIGKQTGILFLALALLCGCGGKGPQRPSQRKGEKPQEDTTQLALMEMTLRMAEAADQAVEQAVQAREETFALYEAHAWIHISDPGQTDEPTLQPEKSYPIHMRVYTLEGKLLEDNQGTDTIGKNQLPHAVDRNLREMHPGAKMRMYAPWYTAFGQQGTEHVPPFENVIIDLEIQE